MNAEEERQDHLPTITLTNLRSSSSQSFTQSINAEEERQDHLPTFATTTESVPSTSVLTWLSQLRAPPSCPSTPPPTPTLFEGIQTRSRQRNQSLASPLLEGMQTGSRQRKRSLASTPSASLDNGPTFRKKQKSGSELDVDMVTSPTHLSTPTSEEASLSRIEPLSSSITSTAMSGPDPQTPVPSKTVKEFLNMAMRLHKLQVKHAQVLQDVKAFSKAYSQQRAAERAIQEFQRIRKTGTYSKAYSQQRLAELAIQEMQLTAEVEAYIKAYRQQHASAE